MDSTQSTTTSTISESSGDSSQSIYTNLSTIENLETLDTNINKTTLESPCTNIQEISEDLSLPGDETILNLPT